LAKRTSKASSNHSSKNSAASEVKGNAHEEPATNSAATVEVNEAVSSEPVSETKESADKGKGFFDKNKYDKKSLLSSALYGIAVLLSALFAFYIRIIPRDSVFLKNGFIRFGENDPWYHWRNINYLLNNYPDILWFDPATTYPFGTGQAFAPLYDLILATVIKILQFITGNTTEAYAMTVSAYWPCVLAGVCVVVVYFAAKLMFNSRPIGLLSAFLVAVTPGQFLSRSIIGFNDHHVAEVLFSTIVVIFLIAALLKAKDKVITFEDISKGKLSNLKPILPYAILTGIAMGAYTLIWEGALLFAFIIGVFITIQMILNHLKGEGTAFIAMTGVLIFIIDFLVVVVTPQIGEYKSLHMMALGAGIIAMFFMAFLSYFLEKKNLNKIYFPAILAGLGIVVAVVGSLISSTIRSALLGVVGFFTRTGGALTIGEASPFFGDLDPRLFIGLIALFVIFLILSATPFIKKERTKMVFLASWSLLFFLLILTSGRAGSLYNSFSVLGFIWLFALPMVAYSAIKNNSMEKTFLVIWTLVILWALVQQNRFSYYFIVPLAILASWIVREIALAVKADEAWHIIQKNLSKEERQKNSSEPVNASSSKQNKANSQRESSKVKHIKKENDGERIAVAALSLFLVFLILFIPIGISTNQQVSYDTGGPNDAWIDASLWLRDNTPKPGLNWLAQYEQPLQDADGDGVADSVSGIGIEHFENQVSTIPFNYPEPAYGVLSWWDYGHWLEVIGERMVNANPFQFGVGGRRGSITDEMIPGAAPFFVAESEEAATGYLIDIDPREGKVGARYIVTDIEMATGKFYAMTAWTLDSDGYHIVVTYPDGSRRMVPGTERYFNSMVFRLHILDGIGLEQYRMVHESRIYNVEDELLTKYLYNQTYPGSISESPTGYVKTFEYVEGAILTGTASPGSTVNLNLTVQTNQNRIIDYTQSVTADASGTFSFRVPYSTTGALPNETNFAVKPTGGYTISSGGSEVTVNVSETDVLNGNTVNVTLS